MAPQLPHLKIVPEAQQLLDDEEYDKTSKSYGHVCTAASPLWESASCDLDILCNPVLVDQTLSGIGAG